MGRGSWEESEAQFVFQGFGVKGSDFDSAISGG